VFARLGEVNAIERAKDRAGIVPIGVRQLAGAQGVENRNREKADFTP